MARYIAFSLYGDLPLYIAGMIENIRVAPQVYPGWDILVYASPKAVAALEARRPWPGPARIIQRHEPAGHEAMFWRFEAACLPDAEYAIFRDADSRLNVREKAAVDEWIASGRRAHVMRDHPDHARWGILGGMWGLRANAVPHLLWLMAPWQNRTEKLDDMRFLARAICPLVFGDMMHHSSVPTPHPNPRPFPPHPPYAGFVGEVVPVEGA